MMRYRDLLSEGKDRMVAAGQSDQAAMLLLNELCQKKDINLYMDMDEEVDPEIQTDYLEGIHRMEKANRSAMSLAMKTFMDTTLPSMKTC